MDSNLLRTKITLDYNKCNYNVPDTIDQLIFARDFCAYILESPNLQIQGGLTNNCKIEVEMEPEMLGIQPLVN